MKADVIILSVVGRIASYGYLGHKEEGHRERATPSSFFFTRKKGPEGR